jgi:two-component system chemotaxis sensor kinase CheA
MDALADAFRSEARDVLETLEAALLGLEEDPGDREGVDAAFRALHTLKGSGAMAGFGEIERFVHRLENAFDAVRSGARALDPGLVSVTLSSLDHVAALVDAPPAASPDLRAASDALLAQLESAPRPRGEEAPASAPRGEIWGSSGWYLEVSPEPELLLDGMDPVDALRGLERLGDLVLVGLAEDPPRLEALEPGHVSFRWRALLVTEASEAAIEDVLFFLTDRAVLRKKRLAEDVRHDAKAALAQDLAAALRAGDEDQLRDLLTDTPAHAKATPAPAPAPARGGGDKPQPPRAAPAKEEVVKVPAAKLDVLVDLVGEMVIAQARLAELAKRHDDEDLVAVAEDLERMCTDMRDSTMELRMLPIGTTFARFKRLVRDVSMQLGKKIQLITDGEDTELDKTVIDKLSDPMIHLIRNALDHGLEPPEERAARGKPEAGTIWLSARHSDTNVAIEVRDDGKGLDAEKIRQKAIERGLVDANAALSKSEAQELIFAPGFSTAASVSALSGRGVGMDAVKTAVQALRGDISVRSTLGEGTCIRIELPLTLAIIEGLLVTVEEAPYVVPLSLVEECIEVPETSSAHRHFTELRGELVPYHALGPWFGHPPSDRAHQQIVVTSFDGRRVGFVVDDVIGQHQTVIKSLGKAYRGVEGISGATILGNGQVALILDPGRLTEAIERTGRAAA